MFEIERARHTRLRPPPRKSHSLPAAGSDLPERPTPTPPPTHTPADGTVAFPGGPRAVPASSAITPGQWHAVTVTAQPGAPAAKGYRVYLNGQVG